MPQLLKPVHLEPVLCNKKSHCNEKPAHHSEEQPPLTTTRESLHARSKEDPTQPKINKFKKKKYIVGPEDVMGQSVTDLGSWTYQPTEIDKRPDEEFRQGFTGTGGRENK